MLISDLTLLACKNDLVLMGEGKRLINTVNAYSFCVAQENETFAKALKECDYLIPDGAGIVKANKILNIKPRITERITGWDLFEFEMNRLQLKAKQNDTKAKVLFLGSSESVLSKIRENIQRDFTNLLPVTYSPPFKSRFSDEDNERMISFVNNEKPDLLWIGMTAPKQEVWAFSNWEKLNLDCHVGCIGAVFDFYAGTLKRAPLWMQQHSLEWLYRFVREPRRTWKRYITGNIKFLQLIVKEKNNHEL